MVLESMAKMEDQLTKGHAGEKRKHSNNPSPTEKAKKTKTEETPETLAALNAPVDVLPPPMPETSLLLTEQEEEAVSSFLTNLRQNVTTAEVGTQTDPPPQSPLITDLSCPVHEWEPLRPGSCGKFHYERCGQEGCLVFIPTQHLDVMLRELKDHLHPTLKHQWESLRCECGLRPRMKLSLSEKNYQKIYLTCRVNQRGVEEFGKVRCRYFQWIYWKPRVPKDQQQQGPESLGKEKLWKGGFVVGGSYNTSLFPEEFRNLDSRPFHK